VAQWRESDQDSALGSSDFDEFAALESSQARRKADQETAAIQQRR
jgi:hypothetical protein